MNQLVSLFGSFGLAVFLALGLEILEAFFGVATFYYLSRFVSNDQARTLPPGSDYFAFAL